MPWFLPFNLRILIIHGISQCRPVLFLQLLCFGEILVYRAFRIPTHRATPIVRATDDLKLRGAGGIPNLPYLNFYPKVPKSLVCYFIQLVKCCELFIPKLSRDPDNRVDIQTC